MCPGSAAQIGVRSATTARSAVKTASAGVRSLAGGRSDWKMVAKRRVLVRLLRYQTSPRSREDS